MDSNFPDHLIVRFLSGEATSEEQLALHDWVSQSADNRKRYNDFCRVWRHNIRNLPEFDSVAALARLDSRISEHAMKPLKTLHWVRMAAGFILMSLIGWALYYLAQDRSPAEKLEMIVRTASPGQKRTIRLADGSQIVLNSNSTLRWPKQFRDTREVFLEGEAFFEVAHDAQHPFIVHAPGLDAKVLGTAFNIRQSGDAVAIALASGKVEITGKKIREVLLPAEKLTYAIAGGSWTKEKADLEKELAWKEGTILLDNEPLHEVASRLESWYNVRILFESEAIRHCRVTGKFRDETLENVLNAISDATGIHYEISNQEVKLSGNRCH